MTRPGLEGIHAPCSMPEMLKLVEVEREYAIYG